MRWPIRFRRGPRRREAASLQRHFITPEGVDLRLRLGGGGARAAAFLLDWLLILLIMIALTLILAFLVKAQTKSELALILWFIGLFVLRNGWFILFEAGSRGATPGKRVMGLRVVARDGGRLSGGAVVVRNAMRELEAFLPLSFLIAQVSQNLADAFLVVFALLWSGIFLLFPLFNRDRLRIGDLLAGTWVVETVRGKLADDLAAEAERPRRVFSDAALDLYGIYELQTLETVLRKGREDALATVAATIRHKAGLPDDGDDLGFLSDYYAALCARLERSMMLGNRRDDKFGTRRAG